MAIQQLHSVAVALEKGYLIDDNLRAINKRGLHFCLLSLFAPFYRLFGLDPYSHVRIDNVAKKIITTFNECSEQDRPLLRPLVQKDILEKLFEKTKYPPLKNECEEIIEPEVPTLQWPDENCDITPEQKATLQNALNEALETHARDPNCNLRFVKNGKERHLVFDIRNSWETIKKPETRKISVPLSIHFTKVGRLSDITILAKKVIAEGGETKVRLCPRLLSNTLCVRKSFKIASLASPIKKHLLHKELTGIVPVLDHFKRSLDKDRNFKPKAIILEEKYKCSLSDTVDGLTKKDVSSIAKDLLAGLATLHEKGLAHQDIKPDNVVLQKGKAAITDFGYLNNVEAAGYTKDFAAPEKILYMKNKNRGERPDEKAADIFSMGLTLLMLNLGTYQYAHVLKAYFDFTQTGNDKPTQKKLNSELETALKKAKDPTLSPLIRQMLQIEPLKRPTAQQALAMLA